MARTFGTYSPVVPLGTTWEESLVLEDADGMPIDITGYDVRAQLYDMQLRSRLDLSEKVPNKDRRFGAALEGTV